MNITIIGAGIGGMSAACLLAAKGHTVTVYEKNEQVGGKMNEVISEGYRFDTGPSLLTMPYVLERLFSACGKNMSDYLTLLPLSPICRYSYKDGTQFNCFDDRLKTMKEIRAIAPEDEQAYSDFLDHVERIYEKTADAFIFNPLYDLTDLRNLDLLSFFGIDAFSTVSKRIDNTFKSNYLRKFFKRFATYNGSSPDLAPATLNVIAHVELNQGGFYVDGGLYKIAEALFELAQSLGVDFNFNQQVESIQTSEDKTVQSVLINGRSLPTDLVVANSDASETILNLLGENVSARKKRSIRAIEASCSGYVLLLGIDKKYEQLVHHNIFFSEDYEKEFQQIFEQKVMPDDPTIYIANTSFTNPTDAPENGSNLFVLVNAPYLSDNYSWEENDRRYGDQIIEELEKRGLQHLSKHIVVRKSLTPQFFYEQYLSNKGSIYGTSSNNKFSAFIRPRNKLSEVNGLYMVGGSTHPGGGIPLAVQSAINAVTLIDRFESTN